MRLLIALTVVMLLYGIQAFLYRRHWNTNLKVFLSFSRDVVNIGDQVVLTEVIENKKSLPLPILHVKFKTSRTFDFDEKENAQITDHYYRNDVFSILGRQRVTRKLPFTTTHRGYFAITELHITSRDLFLTKTFANVLPNQTALYVFPKLLALQPFPAMHEQMLGDFHTHRQSIEDPFAICGIRKYQSFDTMKSINWKATAHTGMLMVNQFEPATSNEVRIFLNLTPYVTSFTDGLSEHAINIANTVGCAFIEDNVDVSLHTNVYDIVTKKPSQLYAGHSMEHKTSLSRILSRIDLHQKCSDFMELITTSIRQEDHPVSYIMISTYRDDSLFSFFEGCLKKENIYWIIPEYAYADVHFKNSNIMKWEL